MQLAGCETVEEVMDLRPDLTRPAKNQQVTMKAAGRHLAACHVKGVTYCDRNPVQRIRDTFYDHNGAPPRRRPDASKPSPQDRKISGSWETSKMKIKHSMRASGPSREPDDRDDSDTSSEDERGPPHGRSPKSKRVSL